MIDNQKRTRPIPSVETPSHGGLGHKIGQIGLTLPRVLKATIDQQGRDASGVQETEPLNQIGSAILGHQPTHQPLLHGYDGLREGQLRPDLSRGLHELLPVRRVSGGRPAEVFPHVDREHFGNKNAGDLGIAEGPDGLQGQLLRGHPIGQISQILRRSGDRVGARAPQIDRLGEHVDAARCEQGGRDRRLILIADLLGKRRFCHTEER